MKQTILVLLVFFLATYIHPAKLRLFEGKLDDKGKMRIEYNMPVDTAFFIQAFISYKDSWRPLRVFWNNKEIWADMGSAFRDLPYRVNLMIPEP